jgi:hypothetical protein
MRAWTLANMMLRLALLAALLYLAGVFGNRLVHYRHRDFAREQEEARARAAFLGTYGGSAVKILQFYTRDGQLVEGRATVLCYGVLNARSVNIEPKVEGVSPALNRCVEVSPLRDTKYTLTAEGTDGQTVTAAFTLPVVPDEETLPRIKTFGIDKQGVDRGRPYFVISFSVENAVTVAVDPPVIPVLHGAPLGRFTVSPEKSTTYTLTVTGKHGHKATKQLKVKV